MDKSFKWEIHLLRIRGSIARRETLSAAIELPANVERDFKTPEEIAENRDHRLAWLDDRDDL